MNIFPVDKNLESNEICNLHKERQMLLKGLKHGKHFVIYGKRNMGKTSVLKGIVIPELIKNNPNAFVLFADLMGVVSLEQIEQRIYRAFQMGFSKANPSEAFLKGLYKSLQSLRPTMSLDPVSGPSFSLGMLQEKNYAKLADTFQAVSKMSKRTDCLVILDEFQDISRVEQAEALFRQSFQELPSNICIYLAGSKKHILAKIFAKHSAPLAGFGEDILFSEIPHDEYHAYMEKRFKLVDLSIPYETSVFLQELMFRIPESIHIICNKIIENKTKSNKKVTEEIIFFALKQILDTRQSRLEEDLRRFSEAEQKVLKAISHFKYVKNPAGKEIAAFTGLSQKGVSKIFKKLEDDAEIYISNLGYHIAEPLLHYYLESYR